jgi:XRE family transcriptional regulator, regulator of sulfur utilization
LKVRAAVKRHSSQMRDPGLDLDQYAAEVLGVLGGQLRELRTERGWTQRELADRAGVHVNVIGSIERGRSAMRISTLVAIAGALDMTSAELLGETERRVKADGAWGGYDGDGDGAGRA